MTISQTFKKLAVGATLTAAMLGAAAPAMAGKDFIKKDLRDRETRIVQLVGQELSHDNLTIVVHGGNKTLMMRVYEAAQRLDDAGYSVAFLLAPDRDSDPETASVEIYTDGYTKYYSMLYDNDRTTSEQTIQGLYEHSLVAYNYAKAERAKKSGTDGVTIASASPK